jgi:aspartyl-tRNA(Asn)/glutamyl-tRNA(Gln) amidotransferase subunit A
MAKTKMDEAALPFATLSELHQALQQREISSRELTKFFIHRLKKYGDDYNAVASLLEKRAHENAGDDDYDLKHERGRSPLKGIPYGAKDLLAVAKHPTTWGAKPFADQVFDDDAAVIARLDGAGAVLIAKLAMIELAGGGGYSSASASLQGPCKNPWNPLYWAGGSSSGSAAAVAAGLVPFALGSETSGSIMTPASFCGISGLRPTYGLVSRRGAMALSWTLDKIGVLARSADDCGLVLHEIAAGDDYDPNSAHKSFYYAPKVQQNVQSLRIGYAEIDWSEWPDEGLRPAYATALAAVKSVGAQMVESKLPDFPYGLLIGTIIDSEAASIFEQFIRGGAVDQLSDPMQIAGLKASLNYSAVDYLKAMRVRRQVSDGLRDLLANVDLLVAPARFSAPDRADRPFDQTEPKRPERKGVGGGLIQASNLAGLPAIGIPCGFVNGLPIGLQIVGEKFHENVLLGFAHAFQEQTDFHKQHPSVG